MVFYFSGTGNSYVVARFMASSLGEECVDIAKAARKQDYTFTIKKGERLGFAFPIYAWAPPKMVSEFVKNLELYFEEDPYIYGICTCGGAAGNAIDHFARTLEKNGLTLDSGFSIVMPDNYVAGFDVPPVAEQKRILAVAEKTQKLILQAIGLKRRQFFRVKRGVVPGLFTTVIHPGFQLFATRTAPFFTGEDCNGCGLCGRVCTSGCIRIVEGEPVWTKAYCNMCLACLNRCPQKAIQYGTKTAARGRYVHPGLKKREELENGEHA